MQLKVWKHYPLGSIHKLINPVLSVDKIITSKKQQCFRLQVVAQPGTWKIKLLNTYCDYLIFTGKIIW